MEGYVGGDFRRRPSPAQKENIFQCLRTELIVLTRDYIYIYIVCVCVCFSDRGLFFSETPGTCSLILVAFSIV